MPSPDDECQEVVKSAARAVHVSVAVASCARAMKIEEQETRDPLQDG